MTKSIYDFHDNEIAAAREIARRRAGEIAEAAVIVPLTALVVAAIIVFA